MPARVEPEGPPPPADLLPPDLLPEPAGSQANIGKVINQPTIDDLPLPKIGSAFAGTFLGPRQGGDYDGEESLTPDLPELKPVPMPVAPAEDIDPGLPHADSSRGDRPGVDTPRTGASARRHR